MHNVFVQLLNDVMGECLIKSCLVQHKKNENTTVEWRKQHEFTR